VFSNFLNTKFAAFRDEEEHVKEKIEQPFANSVVS